jgi:hypothetical protein
LKILTVSKLDVFNNDSVSKKGIKMSSRSRKLVNLACHGQPELGKLDFFVMITSNYFGKQVRTDIEFSVGLGI